MSSLMLLRTRALCRAPATAAGRRSYRTGIRGAPLAVHADTLVLGVESSADDSAAAVMDGTGRVLGECVLSQFRQHREYGGIWPMRAKAMHERNLPLATAAALAQAGASMSDIAVVAFTIGPGLAPCLTAGRDHCQLLAERHRVPLLPVHHMHAHALTARLCTRNAVAPAADAGGDSSSPSSSAAAAADGESASRDRRQEDRPQAGQGRRDNEQDDTENADKQQQQQQHRDAHPRQHDNEQNATANAADKRQAAAGQQQPDAHAQQQQQQQDSEENGKGEDDEQVTFPFLVLLVSGGHCSFAVAEDVSTFRVLGSKLARNTPGAVLDKAAYLLRLHLVPGLEALAPGAAVEAAAAMAPGSAAAARVGYTWPHGRRGRRDCSTEFHPFLERVRRLVVERDRDADPEAPVPGFEVLSAELQAAMMAYVAGVAERAALYCRRRHPRVRHVVVSGGVGANRTLRRALADALRRNALPWRLVAPPPRLCTDNGVMIAWAGLEYMRAGIPPLARSSVDGIWFEPRLSIGEDVSELVAADAIRVPRPKVFLK